MITDPANHWVSEASKALPEVEFKLIEDFITKLTPHTGEHLHTRQARAWEITSVLAKAGLFAYDMDECNAITNTEALASQYHLSASGAAEAYAALWDSMDTHYGPDFASKRSYVLFQTARDAR